MAYISVFLGFYAASLLLSAAVFLTLGACLPAFIPALLLYVGVAVFSDVSNIAASNGHIAAVLDAYSEARRALRELAARAREHDPWNPRVVEIAGRMALHDQVLGSYMDADRWKARVLGFVVTVGAARRMLVTVVTVCVTLWSVLRSAGLTITLDVVCAG
ncbi:hypothetical protein DFJ74DRAFT_706909 [Hyaloraphidium curvatum]|nr:hypothetical protein DFJ74DRAFT_706909 [Hyaloraphidium curvatum]